MMFTKTASSGKNATSPGKVRPARCLTMASALPPVPPPLAEITTITCTTTKGAVSCFDELGEAVRGSKLKDLQTILKPITEAPALTDVKPEVKVASSKAPDAPKPVEAKPVSSTPAASKDPEVKAKPAVAPASTPEAKPVVTSEAKPEAKPAVAQPQAETKSEVKPTVVTDSKPAAPPAVPALSDAVKPEAKPVTSETKPAAEPKATVVTESKPPAQTPPVPQTVSGDAKPPAPAQPKPSAPADTPKPPAPTQAASSGTPVPQSTPSTPDATGPPSNSKPTEPATTSVSATPRTPPSSTLALKNPDSSGPVTLATPDLSPPSRGNEVRTRSVARGNIDSMSFSTGTAASVASGNSTLGLDAPIAPGATSLRPTTAAGRFPGNVDPADFLPVDEFEGISTTVSPLKTAVLTPATKAKTINVMNDKGLIPGNLPPELGEILQLVNAVNTTPVKNLDLRIYPGNVPPDAAPGSGTPTVLEFSPGNSVSTGKEVQAVKMQLTPGNVTPELGDMLEFFGIGPSAGA